MLFIALFWIGVIVVGITLALMLIMFGPHLVFFHRNHPLLLSTPMSLAMLYFMFISFEETLLSSGVYIPQLFDGTNGDVITDIAFSMLLPFLVLLVNVTVAFKVSKKYKTRKKEARESLVVD